MAKGHGPSTAPHPRWQRVLGILAWCQVSFSATLEEAQCARQYVLPSLRCGVCGATGRPSTPSCERARRQQRWWSTANAWPAVSAQLCQESRSAHYESLRSPCADESSVGEIPGEVQGLVCQGEAPVRADHDPTGEGSRGSQASAVSSPSSNTTGCPQHRRCHTKGAAAGSRRAGRMGSHAQRVGERPRTRVWGCIQASYGRGCGHYHTHTEPSSCAKIPDIQDDPSPRSPHSAWCFQVCDHAGCRTCQAEDEPLTHGRRYSARRRCYRWHGQSSTTPYGFGDPCRGQPGRRTCPEGGPHNHPTYSPAQDRHQDATETAGPWKHQLKRQTGSQAQCTEALPRRKSGWRISARGYRCWSTRRRSGRAYGRARQSCSKPGSRKNGVARRQQRQNSFRTVQFVGGEVVFLDSSCSLGEQKSHLDPGSLLTDLLHGCECCCWLPGTTPDECCLDCTVLLRCTVILLRSPQPQPKPVSQYRPRPKFGLILVGLFQGCSLGLHGLVHLGTAHGLFYLHWVLAGICSSFSAPPASHASTHTVINMNSAAQFPSWTFSWGHGSSRPSLLQHCVLSFSGQSPADLTQFLCRPFICQGAFQERAPKTHIGGSGMRAVPVRAGVLLNNSRRRDHLDRFLCTGVPFSGTTDFDSASFPRGSWGLGPPPPLGLVGSPHPATLQDRDALQFCVVSNQQPAPKRRIGGSGTSASCCDSFLCAALELVGSVVVPFFSSLAVLAFFSLIRILAWQLPGRRSVAGRLSYSVLASVPAGIIRGWQVGNATRGPLLHPPLTSRSPTGARCDSTMDPPLCLAGS